MATRTKILFVCMGNICRSPTAEGVTRALAERLGLSDCFEFDSAGTHDYHIGKAPDPRTRKAAAQRGYELDALRGRQVSGEDFERFDLILAMDRNNLALLQEACPPALQSKLRLLLEFAEGCDEQEVPDPYHGGAEGFERVLDLVENAANGLLRQGRH